MCNCSLSPLSVTLTVSLPSVSPYVFFLFPSLSVSLCLFPSFSSLFCVQPYVSFLLSLPLCLPCVILPMPPLCVSGCLTVSVLISPPLSLPFSHSQLSLLLFILFPFDATQLLFSPSLSLPPVSSSHCLHLCLPFISLLIFSLSLSSLILPF